MKDGEEKKPEIRLNQYAERAHPEEKKDLIKPDETKKQ
jgi:hypothetical protein